MGGRLVSLVTLMVAGAVLIVGCATGGGLPKLAGDGQGTPKLTPTLTPTPTATSGTAGKAETPSVVPTPLVIIVTPRPQVQPTPIVIVVTPPPTPRPTVSPSPGPFHHSPMPTQPPGGEATPTPTPSPTPTPTPTPIVTPEPTPVGPGVIVFGTTYDKKTLLIENPIKRFKRYYPRICWTANLNEPAGTVTLKLIIAKRSGTVETPEVKENYDVADPGFDRLNQCRDLAGLVDQVVGTHVVRLVRGAKVMAEGEFVLVR